MRNTLASHSPALMLAAECACGAGLLCSAGTGTTTACCAQTFRACARPPAAECARVKLCRLILPGLPSLTPSTFLQSTECEKANSVTTPGFFDTIQETIRHPKWAKARPNVCYHNTTASAPCASFQRSRVRTWSSPGGCWTAWANVWNALPTAATSNSGSRSTHGELCELGQAKGFLVAAATLWATWNKKCKRCAKMRDVSNAAATNAAVMPAG